MPATPRAAASGTIRSSRELAWLRGMATSLVRGGGAGHAPGGDPIQSPGFFLAAGRDGARRDRLAGRERREHGRHRIDARDVVAGVVIAAAQAGREVATLAQMAVGGAATAQVDQRGEPLLVRPG